MPDSPPSRSRLSIAIGLLVAVASAAPARSEVATDQRQVAVGYERLEALALRIADSVEAEDPARAEQIRLTVGEARSLGLTERFESAVALLEAQRYAAARRDQAELASLLEQMLRLVTADPNAARIEEERRRLEELRREVRGAVREQRALRSRAERDAPRDVAPRQESLAERVERLRESARESDRLAGRDPEPADAAPSSQGEEAAPPEGEPTLAGIVEAGAEAMRQASQSLREGAEAGERQLEAQRHLEAAQREIEQRLTQVREEEQQRRLASLAERFRRMHEAQVSLANDTTKLAADRGGGDLRGTRTARLAVAKLASRQGDVRGAGEDALRVVRADASSRVFDDALAMLVDDLRATETRLREAVIDATTSALQESAVEALAELIGAVDEALDGLDQQQEDGSGQPQAGGGDGESSLVSKIAELRMLRAIQARLLRQTKVWQEAGAAGEAPAAEVADRLAELAAEQRRLAEAAAEASASAP